MPLTLPDACQARPVSRQPLNTAPEQWIYVARIFHLDWLRYAEPLSRAARDQALSNARYAMPAAHTERRAIRLAARYGRAWSDCGAYERQLYRDAARDPSLV